VNLRWILIPKLGFDVDLNFGEWIWGRY